MQSHKLTHDSILNSMKDGKDGVGSAKGVAKFALGPQKSDEINKFDIIKPAKNPMEDLKLDGALSLSSNGYYVPANLENVSALSYKLLMEGMEKMAKEAEEFEVQKKYQEELKKLNEEATVYAERKKELDEQAKIAECFNLKGDGSKDEDEDDYKLMEEDETDDSSKDGLNQKTMVSADGMSMFILPTSLEDSMDSNDQESSDVDKDDEESEQNSSKESTGLNREGVTDKSEGDAEEKMEGVEEGSKTKDNDVTNGTTDKNTDTNSKEVRISPKSSGVAGDKYTKPCPKSKKPGYVPAKPGSDIRIVTSDEAYTSKPMVSCINPKINELIKAKVEQNLSQSPLNVTGTTQSGVGQILSIPSAPKLAFIPNSIGSAANLQSLLLPVISGVTSLPNSLTSPNQKTEAANKPDISKMYRCEHCCMWFEDNAMHLLHNTLHTADEADPFTCRKCYKKLGNRLEFMAHLVWHLEPNMDI